MASRILVIGSIACLFLLGLVPSESQARQELRLYKANKLGQTSRIWFTTRKSKKLGCQNLIKKRRVFRLSHFGYQSCSIYSAKDCEPSSIMAFERKKDKTPTTELDQGFAWTPIGEHVRGEPMKSWQCSAKSREE